MPDSRHDFDFLMGTWQIYNERLVERLKGCTVWESFEARGQARPLPGGIGNYDEFVPVDWRPGFVGMSLRSYRPATDLWSIYWLDNKTGGLDAAGNLLPPVVGRFDNGVGVFEGDDTFEGRPIRVRFIWSGIGPDRARWEQAFSPDGGASWEINWIMRFTRSSSEPS